MQKPKKSRKLLWIILALIIVVIAVGGFVLYRTGVISKVFRNKNIVARVGTHNITKQEVQKVKQDEVAAGFYADNDEAILKLIMDYWLYKYMAEEYGIKSNNSEALDYLSKRSSSLNLLAKLDINNEYVKYRAYKDYYQQQITTIINTPQKGAYILAHFDQNFDRTTPELKALSDQQYQDLLKADKDYATNFINSVYSKIKSGEITFEKGMQLQLDDKVIGKKALSTSAQSTNFGQLSVTPGGSESIARNSQVQAKLNELKPGGISEPFILKAPSSISEPNNQIDILWMIVKLDFASGGPRFTSINAALQNFKKKYGYEVFN